MAISATSARAEVTLDVLYTTPGTFNALHQELAKRFTEANPDIKVKFRNPVASYEEAAQQILRDQITGRLPDVAFNGINQISLFVDRGLGAPLDEFADGRWRACRTRLLPDACGARKIQGQALRPAVRRLDTRCSTSMPICSPRPAPMYRRFQRPGRSFVALGKDIEAKAGSGDHRHLLSVGANRKLAVPVAGDEQGWPYSQGRRVQHRLRRRKRHVGAEDARSLRQIGHAESRTWSGPAIIRRRQCRDRRGLHVLCGRGRAADRRPVPVQDRCLPAGRQPTGAFLQAATSPWCSQRTPNARRPPGNM